MADLTLHVIVRDRNRVLFEGESTGLTSKNSKGIFDVLSYHANFISLLNETLFIHRLNQTDIQIPMNNAIIKVKENRVEVYVGVKR